MKKSLIYSGIIFAALSLVFFLSVSPSIVKAQSDFATGPSKLVNDNGDPISAMDTPAPAAADPAAASTAPASGGTSVTPPGSTGSAVSTAADVTFGTAMAPYAASMSAILTILQAVSAVILGFAAGFMNAAILLTMNIKGFVTATQGVYAVWLTIRDLSGMFVIFMLLYASFKIILGMDEKIGTLIKNIVVAGILINFSFFLTGLAIDASNIVSVQLYHAIAPGSEAAIENTTCGINPTCLVGKMMSSIIPDRGLTTIIMNQLHLQSLWNKDNLFSKIVDTFKASKQLESMIFGVFALVAILATAISLCLAAVAFLFRFFILIFLLAFSPIWFASWIFPSLKETSGKFTSALWSQLIFMPVYLFLLYAALLILGNSSSSMMTSSGGGLTGFVGELISIAFALFALNLPLVTAFSMGGMATGFIKPGTLDKLGGAGLLKLGGKQVASRTVGRGAAALGDSEMMKKLATKSPMAERLAFGMTQKVSKTTGWQQIQKDKEKELTDQHKRIGTVDRGKFANNAAGEAAFKAAGERAKEAQAGLRSKIAWDQSTAVGGLMAGVLGNTTNRAAVSKLTKEANNLQAKEDAETARGKLKEIKDKQEADEKPINDEIDALGIQNENDKKSTNTALRNVEISQNIEKAKAKGELNTLNVEKVKLEATNPTEATAQRIAELKEKENYLKKQFVLTKDENDQLASVSGELKKLESDTKAAEDNKKKRLAEIRVSQATIQSNLDGSLAKAEMEKFDLQKNFEESSAKRDANKVNLNKTLSDKRKVWEEKKQVQQAIIDKGKNIEDRERQKREDELNRNLSAAAEKATPVKLPPTPPTA